MRQSDIREQVVEPVITNMNLAGMDIRTDDSGEVREVLLKYVPVYMGPERIPASSHRSRRLWGVDPAGQERSGL